VGEYHDIFVMVLTGGAMYGAIRYDLKFLRFTLASLRKDFDNHMKKHHGE
jgi:hypothetical protein